MDYSRSNIPEFKCHKKVKAFRILEVRGLDDGRARLKDCTGNYSATVTEEYRNKHNPQVGGYYVLYQDGYESFSPVKAFEGGYSLDEGKE